MDIMVNNQLVQYVWGCLQKGYTYQQVKWYLLQNNWPEYEIDAAINTAYGYSVENTYEERHPLIRFNRHVVFAVSITLVLLVCSLSVFVFFGGSSSDVTAQPDIPTYSLKASVDEGILSIENAFSSEAVEGYTVFPTYRVYESGTNSLVLRWTVTDGIQPGITVTKDLTLAPGTYDIKASLNYKGTDITGSDSFVIDGEAEATCSDKIQNQGETGIDCGGPCEECVSCSDGIKNQGEDDVDCGGPCSPCMEESKKCNDYNPCTNDYATEDGCRNTPIFPCCGNFLCEDGAGENDEDSENYCPADCAKSDKPVELMTREEVLNQGRALAGKDQDAAGEFCDSVPDEEKRDECFKIIAYDTKNKIFCNYVGSGGKRDACYMNFAMEEYDYSVCSKISDPYLKRSCNALKKRPSPD
ncbi:MAG: hypothetical protein ACQESG_01480 [Nanobdellota archaeon]